MRRTVLSLSFVLAACSGSGVSTTARTTGGDSVGEAGSEEGSAEGNDSTPDDDESEGEAETAAADSDAEESSGAAESSGSADSAESDSAADTNVDTSPEPVGLQGAWLSEGDDIAPILVELTHAVSIDATFGPDTFNVVTVDDQGQMVTQLGVYTAEPSGVGEIFNITLEQNMPQAITVEGIFEIDNTMDPPILRYEVVQTEPSVGAVPPTAEGGFGSTSFGADLTQVFVRQ